MRRRRREQDEGVGLDSFLDIVANLVGILIILVMVIGVHARDAMFAVVSAEHATAADADESPSMARQLARVESSVSDLAHEIGRIRQELVARFADRNQLQLAVSTRRLQLDQRSAELNEHDRRGLELESQAATAREELARLHADLHSVLSENPPPEVIEHLPTPLARTVFGEEEHFRLMGGRLVHVPMNQLTDMLKPDAESKLHRLRDTDSFTETIGPVGDFRLQYTLERKTITVDSQLGPAQRELVQLDRFVLVPMGGNLGEVLDEALKAHSQFMATLSRMNPNSTTITVWTYPDSFAEFRHLKRELAERGYLTAARPLPAGMPIGGSPDGTRSSSQ